MTGWKPTTQVNIDRRRHGPAVEILNLVGSHPRLEDHGHRNRRLASPRDQLRDPEAPAHRGGRPPGIAIGGTPGVPSFPANQGNAAANADAAEEKSCLPGLGTTAHSMP